MVEELQLVKKKSSKFPKLPFAKSTLCEKMKYAAFSAPVTAQRITHTKGRENLLDEELKSWDVNYVSSLCKAKGFINNASLLANGSAGGKA